MIKEPKKNGSKKKPAASGVNGEGVQQAISKKAYELYEQRGRHDGYHQEDWLEAERSILSEQEPSEPIQKPLSRISRSKAAR